MSRCPDLLLELGPRYPRLPDDRSQGSNAHFGVIGHGNGRRVLRRLSLHNDVTTPSADLHETMSCENATDLPSRQGLQLTQKWSS